MRTRTLAAFAISAVVAVVVAGSQPASGQRPAVNGDRPAASGERRAESGILVSRQLLESRHLRIGELVQLSADPSGAEPRAFRIDGVYEPVPDPARFAQAHLEARLHLPDLIDLVSDPGEPAQAGTVGSINVALKTPA